MKDISNVSFSSSNLHPQSQASLQELFRSQPPISHHKQYLTTIMVSNRSGRGLFGSRRHSPSTTTTRTENPITGTTKTTTVTNDHRAHHVSNHHHNHSTSTTGSAPVHHHHRRPSIGDKISGAMLKLRGSITGHPGQKVCFNQSI